MHLATLHIDPTGPATIGFTQAAGVPGDIRINFKNQRNMPYPGMIDLFPQLVLRPFTQPYLFAYDIVVDDPTGGSGLATVPGVVMNDRFNIEVYTRNPTGQPQRLLATGRIDLTGYGYRQSGPLGPASFPTGPVGPAGPAGTPGLAGAPGLDGERGSRWYSGPSDPVLGPEGRVEGDMWLDTMTGNVWRWDSGSRSWVSYTGT